MSLDLEKTTGLITVLRGMSSAELAVLVIAALAAVSSAAYAYNWVEGRYVKIVVMQTELAQQQKKIEAQQQELALAQQELKGLQDYTVNLVNSLPQDIRNEIGLRIMATKSIRPTPDKFVQP